MTTHHLPRPPHVTRCASPYRIAPPLPAPPRRDLASRARDLWRGWRARRAAAAWQGAAARVDAAFWAWHAARMPELWAGYVAALAREERARRLWRKATG